MEKKVDGSWRLCEIVGTRGQQQHTTHYKYMKKTLLIAVAALAAGIISSQAQVYSANVVGYYNVTIPAHKYYFFGNQLVSGSDASQTNNNVNTVLSSGLISDSNGATNSVLYIWTGAGYGTILSYFNQSDANAYWGNNAAGWYDGSGTLQNIPLNQGAGAFIYNAANSSMTLSVVGTVPQGTNVINVPKGFNTYALVEPVSTNLDSALVGFPAVSDSNGVTNDVYYGWTGSGFGTILSYFNQNDANTYWGVNQAGWYDGSGANQSANPAVWPTVGQGFIINRFGPSTKWTNSFSVQ
jgi:hypothetical protein